MRRAWDAYFTPESAVRALLKRIDIRDKDVLEPCAGDGAIARVLEAHGHCRRVLTNDLNPNMPTLFHHDATDPAWWRGHDCIPWVISNPPFSLAPEILPLAFNASVTGIAMLLRLSYLEPCENRAEWLAKHPPTGTLILPRISFTGDGKTDNVTCAWFVWKRYGATSQWLAVETKAQTRQARDIGPLAEMFQ